MVNISILSMDNLYTDTLPILWISFASVLQLTITELNWNTDGLRKVNLNK